MSERVASTGGYVAVAIVLLVMTALNIGLAMIDLRGFNSVVSLLIAAVEVILMAVYLHAPALERADDASRRPRRPALAVDPDGRHTGRPAHPRLAARTRQVT